MAEFADTTAGSIAYSVHGEGEPLMLLPGFQSDRTGWRAPNDHLTFLDGFQVINVDPLGHGKSTSSHDEAHYSTAEVVGHVVAVLDQLDIERAHLWGFSRGGLIAALCAELVPDRCSSAVLGASPVGPAWDSAIASLTRAEPLLAAGDWASYWAQFPAPLPRPLQEHFERTNDPRALGAAIRGMRKWADECPGFGLNPSPVARFAYFGTGEIWADAQREALAGADLTVFEGSWPGHAETMLDADGVTAQVVPFLRASV